MTIKILSCGSFLPEKILSNEHFSSVFDTTDEWITQMTGIKQRHVLGENEDFLACSYQAAYRAIQQAGIELQSIDLIVVGTTTPYQLLPSTASMLQQQLGIDNCISFDLQAACSGFVYALANANYLMEANPAINCALVMGCDVFSHILDQKDRTTSVLFGDGFGAFVLTKTVDTDEKGIFYCKIGGEGAGADFLKVPWGIGKGIDSMAIHKPHLHMDGKRVFKHAISRFSEEITLALNTTNLTVNDIHHIIPHQANIRIIQAVADSLSISIDNFHITLDQHGNTSAASIPLAFDDLFKQGKINRGDIILLSAFGAGFTWGTIILEF